MSLTIRKFISWFENFIHAKLKHFSWRCINISRWNSIISSMNRNWVEHFKLFIKWWLFLIVYYHQVYLIWGLFIFWFINVQYLNCKLKRFIKIYILRRFVCVPLATLYISQLGVSQVSVKCKFNVESYQFWL